MLKLFGQDGNKPTIWNVSGYFAIAATGVALTSSAQRILNGRTKGFLTGLKNDIMKPDTGVLGKALTIWPTEYLIGSTNAQLTISSKALLTVPQKVRLISICINFNYFYAGFYQKGNE